jgi:Ca2+-binding EF-hand superfamily protein
MSFPGNGTKRVLIRVERSAVFKGLDKDHSGFVSFNEYVDLFSRAASQRDADRDGMLTLEEFPFGGAFKSADANGDGLLSPEETRVLYTRQFPNVDKNRDGVITPDGL